jgi:hypothetical protein
VAGSAAASAAACSILRLASSFFSGVAAGPGLTRIIAALRIRGMT